VRKAESTSHRGAGRQSDGQLEVVGDEDSDDLADVVDGWIVKSGLVVVRRVPLPRKRRADQMHDGNVCNHVTL